MRTQSQYPDFKFVAKLEHIDHLVSSLKAITFDETATFLISDEGLRILVENSRFIQANLFITKPCFEEFFIQPDEIVRFSVDLNVISECLGIFSGMDSKLKIVYKCNGAPLVLILEHHGENNVTTECSIKTKHYEDPTDYEIDEDSSSYNYLCIRGGELSNLFAEIDRTTEELEFSISPNDPHFRVSSVGVMQSESNIEVAKTSDMMILFNCQQATKARYKFSHVRLTFKALFSASKVAIKTDASGLLELQFMIKADDEAEMYIQFYIMPLVDFE